MRSALSLMRMSLRMIVHSPISTSSSVAVDDVEDAIDARAAVDVIAATGATVAVGVVSADIVVVDVDASKMNLEMMTIGSQHSSVRRMVTVADAVADVIVVTEVTAETEVLVESVASVACKTAARVDVVNVNQESR
jgi:hypothetical protein